MQKEWSGIIYKMLNVLCTVVVALLTKGTLEDLGTFQIFFLSSLASLLFMIPIIKFQTKASLTGYIKKIDKIFLAISIISFIGFCAFIHALKLIDITIVTGISYLTPIIVSFLSIFILKEKYTFKIILALLVSVFGTIIIMKSIIATSIGAIGIIAALVSAISWAFHDLLLKKKTDGTNWTEQGFIILILCIPMALPFAITTWKPLHFKHVEIFFLLGALYTINKMFLLKAISNARLILLAPIIYTKLIFAAIFSYLFFNEVVHLNTIIGSMLIITATILVIYSREKSNFLSTTNQTR
jgi:drug/metabolite transporter (DMT)-like permease